MPAFRHETSLTKTVNSDDGEAESSESAAEYKSELSRHNLSAARTLCLWAGILVILFAVTGIDYLFAPGHFFTFLVLRLASGVICLTLFAVTFNKGAEKHAHILAYAALAAVGASVAVMIRFSGHDSPYYAGLNLVYLGAALMPWGAKKTALICLTIYSAYVGPILVFDLPDVNVKMFVAANQFQFFTIAIAFAISEILTGARKGRIVETQEMGRDTGDRSEDANIADFDRKPELPREDCFTPRRNTPARNTDIHRIRRFENRNPAKPTILLTGSDPNMMKTMVEILYDKYNLLTAFNGFEGLRKLGTCNDSISLILSDVGMPGMNGFDFCERVMKHDEYGGIPFIFITTLTSQEDQLRAFTVGATDFICKPINAAIIKKKVERWTARRNYELMLRDASASLEERVAQLSRVRDIILHEIRNPLQMIIGANFFVDRLRRSSLCRASERERRLWENVVMLERGTEALKSVLEATGTIDVSAASSLRPEPLVHTLKESISRTEHLLDNIDLAVEFDAFREYHINCNHELLVQVFVNLIRNAAEAVKDKQSTKKGFVHITHEIIENKKIMVKVSDNGIGMNADTAANLFRFKYTTKKHGTGIGLHFSKMIVKLHEGTISAESTEGVGTEFRVELPLLNQRKPTFASQRPVALRHCAV
ncbi:MAG: response regulator [Chitinivibrionales bacterium]|nr:response regulator [Chitinivibrionales bacterium]MBD3356928.1 response regulator [Chitinivibrionales bacterium]